MKDLCDSQQPHELPGRSPHESQRRVLEEALKLYLHNVVPAQHLARTEVMKAFEQSVAGNRDLLKRLAK